MKNKYISKLIPFKLIYLLSLTFIFLTILFFWRIIIHHSYIKDLKKNKCYCSNDWREKIVQYGPIINIVIGIILFYLQFFIIKKDFDLHKFNIIPLIFYVIYITYIYKLIKIKCECSNNWKRDFIFLLTIILVVIQIIGIFISFI